LGWIVFPIFSGILLIGAYVLPTVLVGIVVVSFDEAQKRGSAIDEMMQDMEVVSASSFVARATGRREKGHHKGHFRASL
jgi:hypothetical protein